MKTLLESCYRAAAHRFPRLRDVVHDVRRYGRTSSALSRRRAHVLFVPILGMHRSGTSCVAGMLAANGLFLGEDLIASNKHNPKGFYESQRAIRINDALLRRYGGAYLSPPPVVPRFPGPLFRRARRYLLGLSGEAAVVGWKDPRTTVTWPAWHELLCRNRCRIVACFRAPRRVAGSLLRIYDDLDEARAIGVWLDYNRRLLAFADQVVWVNFDSPLDAQIPRVCTDLGLTFRPRSLESFESTLVHNTARPEPTGNVEADAAYAWLLGAWRSQQAAWEGLELSGKGDRHNTVRPECCSGAVKLAWV